MFAHNNVRSRVENVEQFSDAVKELLPMFCFDGVADLGIDIENGGDDGKLHLHAHTHSQVVCLGYVRQLVQHLYLLATIRSYEQACTIYYDSANGNVVSTLKRKFMVDSRVLIKG